MHALETEFINHGGSMVLYGDLSWRNDVKPSIHHALDSVLSTAARPLALFASALHDCVLGMQCTETIGTSTQHNCIHVVCQCILWAPAQSTNAYM